MATERQIEANRRNAARSSGPKSDEGKARSRANATKHGLAIESDGVEAEVIEARESAAFKARRAAWGEEYRPSGEASGWALDRAVAASLRIERCERAIEEVATSGARRARLAWDQDREVEAATIAAGLARAPELVSRKLAASYHGAGLMIELWERLDASLEDEGAGWTEAESAVALDLLGVPADLRRGSTPIDDPAGGDLRAIRLAIVDREIARLDDLRAGPLSDLDDLARKQAMTGDLALIGKESKLILRYERDAWRRYRQSLRELQAPAPPPTASVATPPPPPPAKPEARPAVTPAEVPDSSDLDDLDFTDLIERFDAEFPEDLAPVTERTQFVTS